ncbi:MAG: hypothetical protein IKL58_00160 [Phascolarctobacterium sp.]|nr:hypothetical protein [Phascolarctobacterium sp.]
MLWVIIACVIFVSMAIAKTLVDKEANKIECPAYFPKGGSEFKARERGSNNARRP